MSGFKRCDKKLNGERQILYMTNITYESLYNQHIFLWIEYIYLDLYSNCLSTHDLKMNKFDVWQEVKSFRHWESILCKSIDNFGSLMVSNTVISQL